MPTRTPQRRRRAGALAFAALLCFAASPTPTPTDDPAVHRSWLEAIEGSPKGPFESIRWFCSDGSVLPPQAGACREHGGGVQHGAWSTAAVRLREAGYGVANVLAGTRPGDWLGDDARPLRDLLLERFLIAADDGWIFRGARTYRGALQIEDEQAASAELLATLAGDVAWTGEERFLLLREAARLLPWASGPELTRTRQLAGDLAEHDPGFAALRNKIHSLPDRGDAARVRAHAGRVSANLRARYEELASALDTLYDEALPVAELRTLRTRAGAKLAPRLDAAVAGAGQRDPRERLRATAAVLAGLRRDLAGQSRADRTRALSAGLVLERVVYATAGVLAAQAPGESRAWSLELLDDLRHALFGTGLWSQRQSDAIHEALARLRGADPPALGDYRRELSYLGRGAGWAARALQFHLEPRIERLSVIEPLVREFVPDRLRGSALLAWNQVVDVLQLDAMALGGARHRIFGRPVGHGLRGLNPGLTRGVLVLSTGDEPPHELARDGIHVLPGTVADLPPVAGILTRGEGSSLSHVQLLARNLGIPNVVVDDEHLAGLAAHAGARVVLAVSPQGIVELDHDGPRWESAFGRDAPDDALQIDPDLDKLDLDTWRSAPLSSIRATHSGRIVGPKAANLGELRHLYADAVPRGVVVPFGAFRRLIEQPLQPGGPSVRDWMRQQYAALAELRQGPQRSRATSEFLGRLRAWIETSDPGEAFREDLRARLAAVLGPDGSYGVFVRSDTNVEDLPGFTGAGLNLTVPNVVGFERIMDALRRVWASPFTERAHAWRQAHMTRPEHVYPGVLLLESFASEKSGVMVTADVESGARSWISIAASEGIGGAVDGQAAEELRVRSDGREIRLLAQATVPWRAALDPAGGVRRLPASGAATLLTRLELAQLVYLALELPGRFPGLARGDGAPPADVEFGFRAGRLALLQARPFVESRRARHSGYLQALDRQLEASATRAVALADPPTGDDS